MSKEITGKVQAAYASGEGGRQMQERRKRKQTPPPRAMRSLIFAIKERDLKLEVYLENDENTISVTSPNREKVLRRLTPEEAEKLAEELLLGGSLFTKWA